MASVITSHNGRMHVNMIISVTTVTIANKCDVITVYWLTLQTVIICSWDDNTAAVAVTNKCNVINV